MGSDIVGCEKPLHVSVDTHTAAIGQTSIGGLGGV